MTNRNTTDIDNNDPSNTVDGSQNQLSTIHWQRRYGASLGRAQIKTQLSDFIVEEQLGFEPSGSGEHVFLWVEKSNLNTAFVAESLAKFCGLPLRTVTYAGRKDKYALTRQWFGIHVANSFANKDEPDWMSFSLSGLKVLSVTRNDRKLRVGVLKGNRFELTLRHIHFAQEQLTYQQNLERLTERLELIKAKGAPNYYGSQRFGEMRIHVALSSDTNNTSSIDDESKVELRTGGNLALAQKMIAGEAIRNRNKRSLALSAIRSWLFNEIIHERIQHQCFDQALLGDAMQLSGSNSFFIFDKEEEKDLIASRLSNHDINITAPLVGDGQLHTKAQAKQQELEVLKRCTAMAQALNKLGLKQERRSIRLVPEDFSWEINDDQLRLTFSLPSGCFATSIVRELFDV